MEGIRKVVHLNNLENTKVAEFTVLRTEEMNHAYSTTIISCLFFQIKLQKYHVYFKNLLGNTYFAYRSNTILKNYTSLHKTLMDCVDIQYLKKTQKTVVLGVCLFYLVKNTLLFSKSPTIGFYT